MRLREGRYDDIRTGTDQSSVATEAGAQRQSPPKRIQVRDAHISHILDERDHGRNEGDIINESGSECTEPQDKHGRGRHISARRLHGCFSECCNDARLDQSPDDDKEAQKEEEGDPLYPAKDARMPASLSQSGYPQWEQFLTYRDPGISSAMSRRLMGA